MQYKFINILFLQTITRHRPRPRSQNTEWSRSYPPEDSRKSTSSEDIEGFYERPPSSPASPEQIEDTLDHPSAEVEVLESLHPPIRYPNRQVTPGWRREPHASRHISEQTRPTIGGSRIISSLLDRVLDNSDRRQYGMGWVGRMFG